MFFVFYILFELVLLQSYSITVERYDAGNDTIDGGTDIETKIKNAKEGLNKLDEADANEFKKKIPSEADILIAYATTPGNFLL